MGEHASDKTRGDQRPGVAANQTRRLPTVPIQRAELRTPLSVLSGMPMASAHGARRSTSLYHVPQAHSKLQPRRIQETPLPNSSCVTQQQSMRESDGAPSTELALRSDEELVLLPKQNRAREMHRQTVQVVGVPLQDARSDGIALLVLPPVVVPLRSAVRTSPFVAKVQAASAVSEHFELKEAFSPVAACAGRSSDWLLPANEGSASSSERHDSTSYSFSYFLHLQRYRSSTQREPSGNLRLDTSSLSSADVGGGYPQGLQTPRSNLGPQSPIPSA
eukprot:CAMPEP_0177603384 /NCGR_PEP_ID=MMETSP0419_2-20121207/15479_1 /TAXON_ID=582737 /ORGANISM="Tetraselmis sp., Strain GSL018" /LENGTH=275 /DNA_ID=CAMNT_0019097143 /DNA_START=1316 /DNA_END=2143 /DNA_ORIENTATION=-